MLFALIGAGFAALVAIFAKIGLEGVDTTFATTLRAIVMAVFLIVVALSLGKFDLGNLPPGKALFFIALSGIAGALSWLAMFAALKLGPAPGVSAIDRTSVIFVLIFSILFLGTQFTWKAALGALLIAAGAILLL
ncbi:MAG: bacterial/archaeal transporter family protein [Patescibacteria group bacterium]|nr:bacterial/archaeal transporter family protein [Patescibacteria group bacterium]